MISKIFNWTIYIGAALVGITEFTLSWTNKPLHPGVIHCAIAFLAMGFASLWRQSFQK